MDQPLLAVYFEHPDWFRPLFRELEARGIPYLPLRADAEDFFDPEAASPPFRLLFNRMSPSAYRRGHADATFYAAALLAEYERRGVRVVNGSLAYGYELSKARQLSLLASLGLPFPRSRVVHRGVDAPAAAAGLRFPVLVKANVGGSGAGIVRYQRPEELAAAARAGQVELGIDGVALVQEFAPARDGHIVRVETLGGNFLYAIKVYPEADSFDLCPADACQTAGGVALERGACPADAPRRGLRVEGYQPPAEVVADVERIARAARLDVGGVEYLVDDRDGRRQYYDVNALSNFVADAPRVVGFDPHVRLVDYLLREAAGPAGAVR